jgi:hypothetical protein
MITAFEFSDIPLLTLENVCLTAFVEGEAEISYDPDGQWSINAISLWCDNKGTRKKELVRLDAAHPADVYRSIHAALTMDKSWRDAITDRVAEEMEDALPYPQYRDARNYAGV